MPGKFLFVYLPEIFSTTSSRYPSMNVAPPPRENPRERVIDIAISAFLEAGIGAVTMDSIAHRLTMSKRTLYQLFSDKEELLLACLYRLQEHARKRSEKIAQRATNVMEFILAEFEARMRECQNISPAFFAELKKYPKVKAFHAENHLKQRHEAVEFLKLGVEQGIFRPNINFDIIYPLLVHQLDCFMTEKEFENYKLTDLFANTVMITIRGCATLKGAALMDDFMKKLQEKENGTTGTTGDNTGH